MRVDEGEIACGGPGERGSGDGRDAWVASAAFGASYRSVVGDLPWLHGVVAGPVFGILIDPLALLMLLVVVPIGLLTVLYSTSYLTGQKSRAPGGKPGIRPVLLLAALFLSSMVGVVLAPNFLQLLVVLGADDVVFVGPDFLPPG